jgi:3D (Asp-Asp-Asp) domain-containing protein
MIAELILISTMSCTVTSYRSVPEQTDDTPYNTSIGLHVRKGFCAVSQDLLGKEIHYGDVLYVEILGKHKELSRSCFVADTMNKRIKRGIDFWVATKAEERAIDVRRGRVFKIHVSPGIALKQLKE